MKTLMNWCLLAAVSVMALAGCHKSEASADAALDAAAARNVDPLLSPELKSLAISLNRTIQQFYAKEKRYPADLKELMTKGYSRGIPTAPPGTKLEYDAVKGEVQFVKQ